MFRINKDIVSGPMNYEFYMRFMSGALSCVRASVAVVFKGIHVCE